MGDRVAPSACVEHPKTLAAGIRLESNLPGGARQSRALGTAPKNRAPSRRHTLRLRRTRQPARCQLALRLRRTPRRTSESPRQHLLRDRSRPSGSTPNPEGLFARPSERLRTLVGLFSKPQLPVGGPKTASEAALPRWSEDRLNSAVEDRVQAPGTFSLTRHPLLDPEGFKNGLCACVEGPRICLRASCSPRHPEGLRDRRSARFKIHGAHQHRSSTPPRRSEELRGGLRCPTQSPTGTSCGSSAPPLDS